MAAQLGVQSLFSGLTLAASAHSCTELVLLPAGVDLTLAGAPAVGLLVAASAARPVEP